VSDDIKVANSSFEADHQKDDWINGVRTEDVVAFLDRLYTAKRKAEQRITTLGGYDESVGVKAESQCPI